jgi:hypothetical protein
MAMTARWEATVCSGQQLLALIMSACFAGHWFGLACAREQQPREQQPRSNTHSCSKSIEQEHCRSTAPRGRLQCCVRALPEDLNSPVASKAPPLRDSCVRLTFAIQNASTAQTGGKALQACTTSRILCATLCSLGSMVPIMQIKCEPWHFLLSHAMTALCLWIHAGHV